MSNTEQVSTKSGWLKTSVIAFIAFMLGFWVGSPSSSSTTSIKQSSSQSIETTAESPKPAGKVEVKSHNKKIDTLGYTDVVGEVVNNTDSAVSYVKITATFYDANDKVISTGFAYAGETSTTPLEIGLTSPFEVTSYPDKINVDHYKLDVTWK